MEVGHCLQCCDKMAEEMGETHTMMGCYYNPIIKHAKKGNCSYDNHQEAIVEGEITIQVSELKDCFCECNACKLHGTVPELTEEIPEEKCVSCEKEIFMSDYNCCPHGKLCINCWQKHIDFLPKCKRYEPKLTMCNLVFYVENPKDDCCLVCGFKIGEHSIETTIGGESLARLLVNTTDMELLKSIKYICESRLEELDE